jgi:hypothetical protein
MIGECLDAGMTRDQLPKTGERNERGGADGIGLLLDMARKCSTDGLFWGKTAWWVAQQQMADLLHEGGAQPTRTLGIVEQDED